MKMFQNFCPTCVLAVMTTHQINLEDAQAGWYTSGRKSLGPINQPLWSTLSPIWSIPRQNENKKFGQNCEIWSKMWNMVEIVKSGQICEIWLKLWNFVKIVKFGHEVAPLALSAILATRWRHFNFLQIWPLALLENVSTRWRYFQ